MKYEMIFGDYEFASSTSEIAVRSGYGDILEMSLIAPIVIPEGWGVIAMRRIIKEPKRWTVEDQKAGRLPEVGCVVMAIGVNEDARIAAINNDAVCVVFEDGGFITLHVSGITPIETPAEKAQREEDEFVESTCRQNEPHSTLYSDGVRAAYRRLSGELQAPKWEARND